ncbi:MAG: PotD/PotF family extracellular solute-binding protein [Candidatus Omnitrophota bacterium]
MRKLSCFLWLLLFSLFTHPGFAQGEKAVYFYNWYEYTDQAILDDFEKQTGVKVILREYETKDMMLSEIQSEPGGFDVILASDETIPVLIESRLLEELDLSKITGTQHIKKQFRNPPYDPKNKYSVVAGLWGAAGLAINTKFVPADVDSWSVLWDPKYKDKIALMDDNRDAMSAVLKYSRFSVNTTDPQELKKVQENALLLKANGVQFGDTIGNLEKVMSGEWWIAQTYNGDMMTYAGDRDDIKYVYPKEGFSFGLDNLVISIDSPHREEAYQLINFLMKPENVARNSNMFFYPVTIEAEPYLNKEILENPVISPPKDVLQRGEYILDLGETEGEYLKIFHLLKQIKP